MAFVVVVVAMVLVVVAAVAMVFVVAVVAMVLVVAVAAMVLVVVAVAISDCSYFAVDCWVATHSAGSIIGSSSGCSFAACSFACSFVADFVFVVRFDQQLVATDFDSAVSAATPVSVVDSAPQASAAVADHSLAGSVATPSAGCFPAAPRRSDRWAAALATGSAAGGSDPAVASCSAAAEQVAEQVVEPVAIGRCCFRCPLKTKCTIYMHKDKRCSCS